ncbi:unnamed protein product [Linum trigynum]|uniref:Uncharacterized protein n=1 Tax=Linum trigynum TaxID=586398 RepID=A0AAV2F3U9_9ROSI
MGRSAATDEIIPSYNDDVLRRSDLRILSGPRFLTDRIIEFYFIVARILPFRVAGVGSSSVAESDSGTTGNRAVELGERLYPSLFL